MCIFGIHDHPASASVPQASGRLPLTAMAGHVSVGPDSPGASVLGGRGRHPPSSLCPASALTQATPGPLHTSASPSSLSQLGTLRHRRAQKHSSHDFMSPRCWPQTCLNTRASWPISRPWRRRRRWPAGGSCSWTTTVTASRSDRAWRSVPTSAAPPSHSRFTTSGPTASWLSSSSRAIGGESRAWTSAPCVTSTLPRWRNPRTHWLEINLPQPSACWATMSSRGF